MKKTKQSKTKANQTPKPAPANGRQEIERLVNVVLTAGQAAPVTPASTSSPVSSAGGSARAHRIIKLGLDVHLDRYVVVRQIDGGAPQPPQRFRPAQFLEWARKQTELADQVYKGSVLDIDTRGGMGHSRVTPRKLRAEYPGAVLHVIYRSKRREPIFLDEAKRCPQH
ncbi:MAG: hypothetical protein HY674_17990 [Chloroflexi bacterium]|nr:hypothetical protein [Chloroflexota bacterium]